MLLFTGELDAATGDFSGDVDVDGTLEADAITVNGTALATVHCRYNSYYGYKCKSCKCG